VIDLRTALLSLASAIAALSLTRCLPLRYVTQASAGQHALLSSVVPLSDALAAPQTRPQVRALLARIPAIKAFGEANGLRKTDNYTTYADLHRAQVLWVVSASDELEFKPQTWSFPVVGSFTYLGWFDRTEADEFAQTLRAKGLEVDVRPSRAYSTLGWFKDPVVSPMLEEGPEAIGDLAEVISHESVHATFYVPGQSTLNESVADFLGTLLAARYLENALGEESFERIRFLDAQAEDEIRAKLMSRAYKELEEIYRAPLPKVDKRRLKAEVLRRLRFNAQLRRIPNNASLVQYKTYGAGRDEMQQLLWSCDASVPRMLAALEAMRPAFVAAREHEDPARLLRDARCR
jgi:predicted aminopeptidase